MSEPMGKQAHHIIPRFYLQRFVDPETPCTREPFLWVYRRGRQGPYRRSPKNAARRTGYYAIEGASEIEANVVEKALALLESKAATVLRRTVEGGFRDDIDDRSVLAEFIAVMMVRVPAFRDRVEEVSSDLARRLMHLAAYSEERLASIIRRCEVETGERLEVDVASLREFALGDQYDIEVSPNVSLQLTVGLPGDLAPIIAGMRWAFLRAKGKECFVTSDRPVVLVDPTLKDRFWSPGLAMEDVQVTFALDRRTCLLATWKGSVGYTDFFDDSVSHMNMRTMFFAHECVFSSTSGPGIDGLVSKIWERQAREQKPEKRRC